MWHTNQSTNIIIIFMGKGHVHSFVSMVKKYSMFKMHIYQIVALFWLHIIDVYSDLQYFWKYCNTPDVLQYDTAMLVYWCF